MEQFLKMKNTVQSYAWGSHSAISALLGLPTPSKEPQAELWMGAHPKAPSQVFWQEDWQPLTDILKKHATEILGKDGTAIYGSNLPYLFKVLAAEAPLSIQAHPNKVQAEIGYAKENEMGIALSAKHRNYRDANHKPECLCALTPFWALCGFRPINDIIQQMGVILSPSFEYLLGPIKEHADSKGLKTFFKQLMTLTEKERTALIDHVVKKANKTPEYSMEVKWALLLHEAYSEDIGILSPFFLNLIELAPNEALFLEAGILHAYLNGTGVELMANSDNVLRGGLTSKHIDVKELMQVLNFESWEKIVQKPQVVGPCQSKFHCPVKEFELSIITINEDDVFTSPVQRGVEILLCTEGKTIIKDSDRGTTMELSKGSSLLVPADLKQYTVTGRGVIFKARGPV
ncbi:MAG: mannose-6-phosphate isomerase, class I [Desulfobacteraceae bacterium]|jgi:mannose-6-phosphate isomerase